MLCGVDVSDRGKLRERRQHRLTKTHVGTVIISDLKTMRKTGLDQKKIMVS